MCTLRAKREAEAEARGQFSVEADEARNEAEASDDFYTLFLDKLRRSDAVEVVRSMRRFVNDLRGKLGTRILFASLFMICTQTHGRLKYT